MITQNKKTDTDRSILIDKDRWIDKQTDRLVDRKSAETDSQ